MILAINIGTSSIKTARFSENLDEISRSKVDHIDLESSMTQAVDQCLKDQPSLPSFFGFRVVHGKDYRNPLVVNDQVFEDLKKTIPLAPLHNPPVIHAMEIVKAKYPQIPIVAVFDTRFHTTMPEIATTYAVPLKWRDEFGVKRYGFHGLAHGSMLETYCQEMMKPKEQTTLITLQLGSGCSICAIKDGQSVDTSMGFSPLEGLISRTRTGDIDPAIIPYLAERLSTSEDTIIKALNHESGLLGISGLDGDMGTLLDAEENVEAQLAIAMFVYRIQKYIGSYDAVLGKAQAIVFGGGISEHSPQILQSIFDNPYFGVSLEEQYTLSSPITKISRDTSERHVYLVQVDEEKEIAREVLTVLK